MRDNLTESRDNAGFARQGDSTSIYESLVPLWVDTAQVGQDSDCLLRPIDQASGNLLEIKGRKVS
jgi:hypothetical protein